MAPTNALKAPSRIEIAPAILTHPIVFPHFYSLVPTLFQPQYFLLCCSVQISPIYFFCFLLSSCLGNKNMFVLRNKLIWLVKGWAPNENCPLWVLLNSVFKVSAISQVHKDVFESLSEKGIMDILRPISNNGICDSVITLSTKGIINGGSVLLQKAALHQMLSKVRSAFLFC